MSFFLFFLPIRNASDKNYKRKIFKMAHLEIETSTVKPDPRTRAQRCKQPVVLDKTNVDTGGTSQLILPCGSSNALKCASCAEFQARLRTRQIMNGLEAEGMETALFTLTAPSFGKVHRASYSVKDEFKAKKRGLSESQTRKNKMTVMKKKGACPCGKFHSYTHELIGTPIAAYDYAGEIIWNENLPLLIKSAIRRIKYLANSFGIDAKDLSIYGVYERQKRGSLHAHLLICVNSNSFGFETLVADLKTNWESPTAKIPENRLEWYRSKECTSNWRRAKINETPPKMSIPEARWKKGAKIPAIQFGEVMDVQVLGSQRNDASDGITGHHQASHYISKYLTKNQGAFAPEALQSIESPWVQSHYENFRRATLAICADRIVSEVLALSSQKQLKKFRENIADETTLSEEEQEKAGEDFLKLLKTSEKYKEKGGKIERQELIRELYRGSETWRVDRKSITEIAGDRETRIASKSLVTRLNKILDNAGFTGSLVVLNNWNTTLTSLKEEMREWARSQSGFVEDTASYEYELNIEQMRKERKARVSTPLIGKSVGLEAVFSVGLAPRPTYGKPEDKREWTYKFDEEVNIFA